jgi:hypothetical protein
VLSGTGWMVSENCRTLELCHFETGFYGHKPSLTSALPT